MLESLHAAPNSDYMSLIDRIDAGKAWNIVDGLSSDRFEGRRAGTAGDNLASDYVADYFQSIGLRPAGENGAYKARFSIPLWQLTRMPSMELLDNDGGILQAFEYRREFNVIPGSGSGNYSADVVFVGYAVSASSLSYDDFHGISVSGKIALAMVGTPPGGRFEEGNYGATYVKADNALRHGAAGLILVDSPAEPDSHYVERARYGACWTIYEKLTIQGGTIEMADMLLKDNGLTLSVLQQEINRDFKPRSLALGKRLHVSVQASFMQNARSHNVLGFIPGDDLQASNNVVIIGAHHDHWGKDVDGGIFRGANDDASGVAVMMEIARVFSGAARPRWSILFASWSGEEEGFYGSYAYVQNPYFPLGGTIAYLNLDMVGYGQQLLGESSETHKVLRGLAKESAEELGISLSVEGYYGGSDHASFENNGVPNLMFIYWPDDAYHTPADTAAHVSKRNLLDTARLTALVALKLAETRVVTTSLTTSSSDSSSVHTSPASTHSTEIPETSLSAVGTNKTETSEESQVGDQMFATDQFVIPVTMLGIILAVVAVHRLRKQAKDTSRS